jgi:hypothetical protein
MSSVACNLHRLLLSLILNSSKRKNPTFVGWGFCLKHEEPDDYLLSHGSSALSSAWSRFTVLFGMGRGGTNSLWSSGMTCCCVVSWGNATTNPGRSSRTALGCNAFVITMLLGLCLYWAQRWISTWRVVPPSGAALSKRSSATSLRKTHWL